MLPGEAGLRVETEAVSLGVETERGDSSRGDCLKLHHWNLTPEYLTADVLM
jgi:hypothetical protein